MQFRESLLNLAITCVVVLIVALVAVYGNAGVDTGVAPARPVSERFLAFSNAVFVDSRANEADTLRLRLGDEENVFVLYFVDALEATGSSPQLIADQARWFGGVSQQTVVDYGVEAAGFVADLLKTKPFSLLTRWERVPNSTRYYAMVVVETEPGNRVYLADLLLAKGYGRIHGVMTAMPEGAKPVEDYLQDAKSLARKAMERRLGVWAKAPRK
jgi:endonuclease YncB( thermonuclease family)